MDRDEGSSVSGGYGGYRDEGSSAVGLYGGKCSKFVYSGNVFALPASTSFFKTFFYDKFEIIRTRMLTKIFQEVSSKRFLRS